MSENDLYANNSVGINKLCEGLKDSTVTSLECAAAPERSLLCQCPLTPARSLILPSLRSLAGNNLTNNGNDMSGTLKLVEILPLTKIESLGCAAASKRSLLCQRPLTLNACLSPLGSVDGHALPIDELKGTKPTEKIDLSSKGLGVARAIIIASCIKGNGVLKELKCAAAP